MSRSKWKFSYIENNVLRLKKQTKSHNIWSRSSTIPSFLVGQKVAIYNGKDFRQLTVKETHIGLKFGELSFTCRKIKRKDTELKNKNKKK